MNQIQFIKRLESESDYQDLYLVNDEKILYLWENKFNEDYSSSNGDYQFYYSSIKEDLGLNDYLYLSNDKEEILNQMKNHSF